MPMRPSTTIIRLSDGYTKIGDGPYVKWTFVNNGDGTKTYTMMVKETPSDTPKEFHSV